MIEFDRLCQRIRAILSSDWDPIGVRDVPQAADEYEPYVIPVANRLMAGEPAAKLARFLLDTETNLLGLDGNARRARAVASKLRAIAKPGT